MTATILQFPCPALPRKSTKTNLQPCEVVSLDAWRRKWQPLLATTDVLTCSIHNEAHCH